MIGRQSSNDHESAVNKGPLVADDYKNKELDVLQRWSIDDLMIMMMNALQSR